MKSELLNEYFEDPYHRGACEHATHANERTDLESGCQVRFELRIADGVIQEAWFDAAGCEICEGISSLLSEYCEGLPASHLEQLSNQQLLPQLKLSMDLGRTCESLPLASIQAALASPLNSLDDDIADGQSFSGPSLREEC